MSSQQTSPDTASVISSPVSEDGHSPCVGLDSKAFPASGPAPVPVSRFRALASDRAKPTSATFGPLFTVSSPSADLQLCLESKLRARMDVSGSPEFALTWKTWDMPAGEPICALRASERRTGDNGCSGWPTCSARYWKDSEGMATEGTNPDGSMRKRLDMLPRVAQLAAWPTPQTEDSGESQTARKDGENLAVIAAWATPRANSSTEDQEDLKRRSGKNGTNLEAQAGLVLRSCHAGTGKRGVLRPGHSRWLMGYPVAWDSCGVTAMQSCRKSRKRS